MQGCLIGIPKNPKISGSSRKSPLGAREMPRVSSRGGEGVVAKPSKTKSLSLSDGYRESRKCNGVGGGGGSSRTE